MILLEFKHVIIPAKCILFRCDQLGVVQSNLQELGRQSLQSPTSEQKVGFIAIAMDIGLI